METTVDQNSATILSLWHCIFAVSANKDAKKGEPLKQENAQALIDIYPHMKNLRLANHRIDNPALISIPEIAKPFNAIFSGMSKEKWVEEFCSFMREVVTMRDELKGLKERLHSIDLSNPSTLLNDNKPKDIITLLTLWYWLAAWSSLDQPKDCCAKDEFIQAMEVQSKALGFLMVKTTPIDPIEQQELQILLSKLLQMLKLDYQLWMYSLNHLIGTLTLQPSKAAEASEPVLTLPTHLKSFNSTYNNTPCISSVSKVGKEVVKGIVTAVILEGGKSIYEQREEILEKLKEMGHDVADITEKEFNNFVKQIEGLVDVTKKGMEELGVGIEEAVKKSVEGLESFGGMVWDGLQDAAEKAGDALKDATEKVGDAIKEGAEEVWKGVKGLGSFLGF